MTKIEQEWYDNHNQNELKFGYCKWAKLFVDKQGNRGYACMNQQACHRWGLQLGSTCCEPWLSCNIKQPGFYEIDKDKIDISSVIYSDNNQISIEKKSSKYSYRNFWLFILIILLLVLFKYI